MLRRELGIEASLEAGPYGSFEVRVGDEVVVDSGALAFMGVLPPLSEIRSKVAERLDASRTPDSPSAGGGPNPS